MGEKYTLRERRVMGMAEWGPGAQGKMIKFTTGSSRRCWARVHMVRSGE